MCHILNIETAYKNSFMLKCIFWQEKVDGGNRQVGRRGQGKAGTDNNGNDGGNGQPDDGDDNKNDDVDTVSVDEDKTESHSQGD